MVEQFAEPSNRWAEQRMNNSYGWAAGVRPSGRAAPKCNSIAKALPESVVVVLNVMCPFARRQLIAVWRHEGGLTTSETTSEWRPTSYERSRKTRRIASEWVQIVSEEYKTCI